MQKKKNGVRIDDRLQNQPSVEVRHTEISTYPPSFIPFTGNWVNKVQKPKLLRPSKLMNLKRSNSSAFFLKKSDPPYEGQVYVCLLGLYS
jgi:hypothetical protein